LREAGWLLSTINLITAVSGVAIALFAEHVGRRRMIIIGTALQVAASLLGAAATDVRLLFASRVLEGLGFIIVVVAIPPLLLSIAAPRHQRRAMSIWSTQMPAGAGSMMLIAALILPFQSWRVVWLFAAAASAVMLAALVLRVRPRHDLDSATVGSLSAVQEIRETLASSGPVAIAVCFGAYSSCWFAVVGFLPILQIDRLGLATSTAAVVTAAIVTVNVLGNLSAGWLLARGVPRGAVIVGAAVSMAFCAAGIFIDDVPDILRLLLAGTYSAVIGVVPGALFTAIPVHAPRPQLVGAATGLLMQGSNIGALLGPPLVAIMVAGGGWPAAAWFTSAALAIVALAGIFLHWRERRKLAP
jgi:predicted MFS family arabinose efflux permease